MNKSITLLIIALSLALACSPKPGEPEYVLGQLEEGLVVGPKNLGLLTEEHVPLMLVSLNNPQVPTAGQVQIAERLVTLDIPDPPDTFGPLLNHGDPEVRHLAAKRLAGVTTPEVASMLIDRLNIEPSEIIRITMAQAIQQLGLHMEPVDPKIAQILITSLERAPENRKLDYVVALSGWPTDQAIGKVFDHVGSGNDARAEAASSGLLALSKTHIEKVAPLTPTMLVHRLPSVRRNGLRVIYYQLSGRGKETKCSVGVISVLEQAVPTLQQKLESFKESANVSSAEKQLVDEILGCMTAPSSTDPAGDVKSDAGLLKVTNTGS